MNDYINQLLKRKKQCQWCHQTFYDMTKSLNAKYCSRKCREAHQNNKQKTKIRQHRFYKAKIKPTQNLRQTNRNYFIGTITEKQLDNRIKNLISICKQQNEVKT
jgi:hypothetical protein